jgi:hypothetical protein
VSAPIPSAFGAFSAVVGIAIYAAFARRWKTTGAAASS